MNELSINHDNILVVLTAGILFFSLLFFFIIYFIFLYRQRQLEFFKKQKDSELAYKQALIELKERTFEDISRELHDNIGQIASLIKINLHTLPDNLPEDAKAKIDETQDLLRQLIADIKAISKGMNSKNLLRLGLRSALENEMNRVKKSGIFGVRFEVNGEPVQLGNEKDIFFLRITQELLSNIIQHAQATEVSLVLEYHPDFFTLSIADNGKGFDKVEVQGIGSGLFNLEERCKIMGAKFHIESEKGVGTSVTMSLQLTNNKNE